MAAPNDPYATLSVRRGATPEEIRHAYRRLARTYHPDVSAAPDAAERFKEINDAYQALTQPAPAAPPPAPATPPIPDLEALFTILFGGAGRGSAGTGRRATPAARPGEDLDLTVRLSFEDAWRGVRRRLRYQHLATCDGCTGTGADPAQPPTVCPTCRGQGILTRVTTTAIGYASNVRTCPDCRGLGTRVTRPCPICGGLRRRAVETTTEVVIPPGVRSGDHFSATGRGNAGINGGTAGALLVTVAVEADARFERRDDEVWTRQHLDVATAALGGRVAVPTVEGPQVVPVPAGTQNGAQTRLAGKGFPRGTGRADQVVEWTVEIPRTLTPSQRALFEQLRKTFSPRRAPAA